MIDDLQTARKFLGLFSRGHFDAAGKSMSPNAVIRWPNTREVFFGRDGFIEANRRYPGKWLFRIERLEKSGRGVAAAARVFSKTSRRSFHVVSFFEFRSGLIYRLTEYWGQDGEPPAWRKRGGWSMRY